jgi:hypothetical protein
LLDARLFEEPATRFTQPADIWHRLHANYVVLIRAVVEQLSNAKIIGFKKALENNTGEPLPAGQFRTQPKTPSVTTSLLLLIADE